MKSFWQWIRSPSYWKMMAIITGVFLTIAVLGKTGDWIFATSIALGFYSCWKFSAHNNQAAHDIKE